MDSRLREILEEIKAELGLEDEIKIIKKNYKRKLASVSLDKRIIRINKNILDDEDLVRKVIHHELLHIKLNTKWHTPEFWEI